MDPADYKGGGWTGYLPTLEHMILPELCQRLLDDDPDAGAKGQIDIPVRDVRDEPLWKLGVIMFELLHGYSPWDSPDPAEPELFFANFTLDSGERTRYRAHRDDRRRRMINEPLPISDTIPMTQDCVDVLRAMLANDPEDRPSVEELASFPWFQGSYVDSGADFTRPKRRDSDGDTINSDTIDSDTM